LKLEELSFGRKLYRENNKSGSYYRQALETTDK